MSQSRSSRPSKVAWLVSSTPAGIKKRGEYISKKTSPRTKKTRPIPLTHPSSENKRVLKNAVTMHNELVSFMFYVKQFQSMVLMWRDAPPSKKKRYIQRTSTYLGSIAGDIATIDALSVAPPNLVFMDAGSSKSRPVPPKTLNESIANFRKNYINSKPYNEKVMSMGIEEIWNVPLATFNYIESIGLQRHLSPFNKSLFMSIHAWIRKHTSARVRSHIPGAPAPGTSTPRISNTPSTTRPANGGKRRRS